MTLEARRDWRCVIAWVSLLLATGVVINVLAIGSRAVGVP
jgi:hypothetical protein